VKRKSDSRRVERRRDYVELNLLVEEDETGRGLLRSSRRGCLPPFAGVLLLGLVVDLASRHLG
jgi:hypothetical protein